MSLIPITTLTPARDPPNDKAIRGIVTLFWPYSSSTRQCAFLLADPDFRLRSKQGQVRVRFTSASAEAVAKSRVGIGDEVVLGLEGARWEEDPEATRTPGRSVDGELFYRSKLGLVLKREGGDVRVDVNAPASPPRAVEQDSAENLVTPAPKAVEKLRGRDVGQGYTYTSPAFVKRLRLSEESFLGSGFDPFAVQDMDDDIGEDGEDRRTSFGRGTKWRYAAKTPSPTKETAPTFARPTVGDQSPSRKAKARDDITTPLADDDVATKLPPPARPQLHLPSKSPPMESITAMGNEERPSKPMLLPVKSHTLPLPSPFPTDRGSQSQQDSLAAKSTTSDQADDPRAPLVRSQGDEIVSEATRFSKPNLPPTPAEPAITQPETPTKARLATQFSFGFDGAAASPPAPQKTSPQDEEKQRVMAQTFRSLFGFTGPLQAQASEKAVATSQPLPEQIASLSELEQQRLGASRTTGVETVAIPDQAVPAVEASSPQLAEVNEVSAPNLVATSPKVQFLEHRPIPAITAITSSEAASPETQFPTSQPRPEIEEATTPATNALVSQASQRSHQRAQEAVEIIEIDSSSEDEDDDKRADLSVGDESRRSHKGLDTYQDSQAEDLMVSQQQKNENAVLQTSQGQASSDGFGALQPERLDDGLLESFIEPEHLFPTLPSPVGPPRELSELEVKGAPPEAPLEEVGTAQQATGIGSLQQQPSYPSLPLSPSNSQSILGMASQAIPEMMPGVLPPTPSLTQVESSASYLQGMLGRQAHGSQDQRTEDSADNEIVNAGSQATYPSLQHGASIVTASEPQLESAIAENDVEVKISQPMDPLQAGAQPPSTKQVRIEEEGAESKEPALVEQPPAEAQPPLAEQIDTGRITRAKAKKATAVRLSSIPDAISSYFSPRSSSTAAIVTNGTSEPPIAVEPKTNGHHDSEVKHLTNGFSTALSYFTPLSHLDSLLNPSSSQQAFGSTNTVDVLAVVTDSTADRVQAKAGPRDHYTIFRITDSSLISPSVRVEVFRPYKETLPCAKEGDVILLRAFAVKSRKRQTYLISSDASAWCVFSFSKQSGKPMWALKAGEGKAEIVSGPPVEFGEEERERARDLKAWWDGLRVHEDDDNDANGIDESSVAAGREPLAAKL